MGSRGDPTGADLDVLGRRIHVESSGHGTTTVVLESGLGFGRTSWDRLVPLLLDHARVVAYDRVGHGRSEPGRGPTSVAEMADILRGVIDATASGPVVVVAHSMGGLIARTAAPVLGPRLGGLVLLDPTPENAAMFDDLERTTAGQDRVYAALESLSRVAPLRPLLARVGIGGYRSALGPETYRTMVAEDVRPSSFAQMRRELAARTVAVRAFRDEPPVPPACPVVLLSAGRAARGSGDYLADVQEHQRQYVDLLPRGHFEVVDATHLVQADAPDVVADRIRELVREVEAGS